ncbi:apical junction component 1 homolog [Pristis pectinata]|uniref:apical junction component 1 homolog n=1 Tax=Pristis pectinata TaxID=685728 RepID=UPI00223DD614|nr:apical junction component 1 homolog [Pristis pectinata]XP_051893219.1 apical junction component 1 homolog [Pristis pectinata]XP_051893220.1 apical junction component 1 homolog [Pristis pectinata]XP_051893221.1 apical junction component 1 homolog [Pristis pectinata]XP_051893222.1 apical junction component 1 homolog [Pristis pectinata]
MTRTDPPDILVSTVYREIQVSTMPGEPKVYRPRGACEAPGPGPGSLPRDVGKRQCRSFDFLQSLEGQPPPPEQPAGRRPDPSPEPAWDSLGRQVYLRSSAPDLVASRLCPPSAEARDAGRLDGKKRGRSKSAPRVKTTYRAVPLEPASPEQPRRGREALRGQRDPHRRAEGSPRREGRAPGRGRMDEVHPIKLQPQRADACLYAPLYVGEPGEEGGGARPGVHVRYRLDMKPPEGPAAPCPRPWRPPPPAWQAQPGRSLTVPSSRRPGRAQSPAGDYWTLATHGCSPQPCRGPERRRPFPQPYPEAHSLPRPPPSPSPLHYHDWWGTYRAAHGHQSPGLPPLWAGGASPHGSCRALATGSRHHSKSWDNILSPGGQAELGALGCRSYETLPLPERGSRCPGGRVQPTVVNLSRSPQRYAALSLSESSLVEKLQGEGGWPGPGRSWYITPEITITDNELRAPAAGGWGRQPADGSNGLSASFNDLLSCNLEKGEAGGGGPGPGAHPAGQQPQPQLDDALADLVIDTCKAPGPRGGPPPPDTLLEQLRKLIGGEDLSGEPGAEPPRLGAGGGGQASSSSPGLSRSPSYPSPGEGPLQERASDEVDTMMCSNLRCGLTETLFNARLYFKSCHSCYTYYCSRGCRKDDWEAHKEACVYGRVSSTCKRVLRSCRENQAAHRAFSRIARMGYLSRGRGVLFLGFPNPGSADNFLRLGLESLLLAPTYLSVRELQGYAEHLGEYLREVQEAGRQYNPEECFLLNVSVALGQRVPDNPSPRLQTPAVRRFAKIALASASPERKAYRAEEEMETLILTPPPGTADIAKDGEAGRRAREVCFINVQRELRIRGVFLRHEYPHIYQDLCEFVESNKRFTPTTIYPIDKRTGRQFMCMIMAASEPLTLEWVRKPNVLEDMM